MSSRTEELYGYHGNGGPMLFRRTEAAGDQCRAHQRPHAIVHGHQAIVLHCGQAGLCTVESFASSGHQLVLNFEVELAAEVVPGLVVVLWQYQHQVHRRVELVEGTQGVEQQRFTLQQQELLGHGGPHALPGPSGDDDGGPIHA